MEMTMMEIARVQANLTAVTLLIIYMVYGAIGWRLYSTGVRKPTRLLRDLGQSMTDDSVEHLRRTRNRAWTVIGIMFVHAVYTFPELVTCVFNRSWWIIENCPHLP